MKILSIVRFNDEEGYVLDEKPVLKYTKYGRDTIIGIDDTKTFISCYGYDFPRGKFKAFAGREFDLKLTDGTTEHCNGQWWDKITDRAEAELKKILPVNDSICHDITSKALSDLKLCYVFAGYRGSKSGIEKLRSECEDQTIYGYWEYESIMKGRCVNRYCRNDAKVKNVCSTSCHNEFQNTPLRER